MDFMVSLPVLAWFMFQNGCVIGRGKKILMRKGKITGRNKMNVLAATTDIGFHPAFCTSFGGLVAAYFAGTFASMALVIAPGSWILASLFIDVGSVSTMSLFGYEILGVVVDRQAQLFGYLFHLAALVAGDLSIPFTGPLANIDGSFICSNCSWCCFCR